MAGQVLLAIFFSLCLSASGQAAVGTYVTADDIRMANDAALKAEAACVSGSSMTIDDYDTARAQLVDASANNILRTIMTEAATQEEMTTLVTERLPSAMIGAAAPLIMFFILLIFYTFCCCWTACPFCKCCRCCARLRQIPFLAKLLFLLMIGGFVLALVIVSSLSTRGYAKATEGFDVTNCAAAKMVNATFQGQADPYFLGLIPVLTIFDELQGSLAAGSTFITSLTGILDNTKEITDAVAVAKANVDLLANMLADSSNIEPTGTLHECIGCAALSTTLAQVGTALTTGTAQALSSARVEVNNQLSGSSLENLRSSMGIATAPLVELKTTVKNAFEPFVSDTIMEQISDQLAANGTVASVFMIGLALVLAACAMISIIMWMCQEKSSSDRGQPVYYKRVHRCACCTWCCGCYYTMLAFFLGGLLTILAVPLSSFCLILEDISSDLLHSIAAPMNLNLTGPEGDMMGSMIDQCIGNATGNPRLLDLISVPDANGNTVTMYDLLVGQTKDQIASQFDQIGTSMNTGGASIATSDDFVLLKNMLSTIALDTMMLPKSSYDWAGDANYQDMLANSDMAPYIASTAACADNVVPTGFGLTGEGTTQKGITSFLSTLSPTYAASTISRSNCASDFTCKTSAQLGATDYAACEAAKKFMDLKFAIRSQTIFKCRRFTVSSVPCTVQFMAQVGGTWTGDCKEADGTFTEVTYDCDLPTFVALVQAYSGLLDLVFARVDSSTSSALSQIQVNLKNLLDVNFLDKIATVGNGVTCGFMGTTYRDVVNGLCYGGVWGIKAVASSYTACAVLTLFLASGKW
ncbi:unnamed protein product [Cladocopium goreaui]|uniref:60S ribosomal protein L13-1 n=1 Tax=Cladocopium goreaui TaxID=2562237 RepID=A0A9P1GBB1_9DINO|nr:unnamed protein product [Cladocopium goreaui]